MAKEQYPPPVIAGETVTWKIRHGVNWTGEWFSPNGPIRGREDYWRACTGLPRGRVILDGTIVKLNGREYTFRDRVEGDLPDDVLTSDLLMDGDELEIISVPSIPAAVS